MFDFDGDGKAEVVYSEQNHLRVYDGTNGAELVSLCNTTATLIEYPSMADVDNDGDQDLVVGQAMLLEEARLVAVAGVAEGQN